MRSSRRSTVAIAIFAREPAPGRAKTRLVPRLGPFGASGLHAGLVRRVVREAGGARVGPVEIHATPRVRAGFLARTAGAARASLQLQRGADLGERMRRAFESALRRHRALVLIGTDCPALDARLLRRAARVLLGGTAAVLAPAEDGGYALIGLRRNLPALFDGIEWGTSTVFAATARRLEEAGARWRSLPPVWDIDRPEDLDRWRTRMFRGRRLSSASRRPARR